VWAAIQVAARLGPEARILAMLPDSGRSYLSKFLDDKWMLEHGSSSAGARPTVAELLRSKGAERRRAALVTISAHQKVGEAIDVMQRYSISQLPVVRDGGRSLADVIGSLQDRDLLERVFKNPDALHDDVAAACSRRSRRSRCRRRSTRSSRPHRRAKCGRSVARDGPPTAC
jgi:cystathionine beta-synthase